jgi:hypothetical protein
MTTPPAFWKRCSSCKNPIAFAGHYYCCSVSTCNSKRTGLVFCSMPCWSAHVPMMGHRDPWAEDMTAPTSSAWQEQEQARDASLARRDQRRIIPGSVQEGREPRSPTIALSEGNDLPKDVLVVVSKLKAYIRARSDFKTSSTANEALSDIIREHCDRAIRRAAAAERSTVMGRDFQD